jgi:GDP-L-fucose synthase
LSTECCSVRVADRTEIDLTEEEATLRWLNAKQPDIVIHAAPEVGGIAANNDSPVEFLWDNLAMELNVIRGSHAAGVQGLPFKYAPQPIQEEPLLSGRREPTNEWCAIAKIAGLKMCKAFRRQFGKDYVSAMPTNLYGLGGNYHPDHSHVPAALIQRFHEAKVADAPTVTVWRTGTPLREFLNVDDLGDACVFLLKQKGTIRNLCHTPSAIRPLLGSTRAARVQT